MKKLQQFNSQIVSRTFQSYTRKSIRELEFFQHNYGSYLLLRTVERGFWMFSIHVMVEDHLGERINFCAYNYSNQSVSPDVLFPVGTIIVLRDPFLKLGAMDGIPMLRCDDPTDFFIIDKGTCHVQRKSGILEILPKETEPSFGESWKAKGNELYVQKKYALAMKAYLTALNFQNSSKTNSLIHVNLAATYLALGNFDSCLEYSVKVMTSMPGNIKAMYRAGRACYKLRRYQEAKSYFEQVISKDGSNLESINELKKCVKRLEEAAGKVDVFDLLMRSRDHPKTRLECADYVGPVERDSIGSKESGLFAKYDVPPGTLLIMAKAFEVDFSGDGDLVQQVAELTQKNPKSFDKIISELASNDDDIGGMDITSGICHVEAFRKVVLDNCLPLLSCSTVEGQYERVEQGTGLFLFPSRVSRALLPNAIWQTYNDVLVLHAIQPISKGEEVTISINGTTKCNSTCTKDCVALNLSGDCCVDSEATSDVVNMKTAIWKHTVPLLRMYIRLAEALLKENSYLETMEYVERAFVAIGLKPDDLLKKARKGEDDVFPIGSGTFAVDLVLRLVVLAIRANEARGCSEEVKAWVKVLVMLERICVGSSLDMVKAKYADIPKNKF